MSDIIQFNLNLSKIPKDKIFNGKNGKMIFVNVAPKTGGADQYGNTHSCYIYDKDAPQGRRNVYLGDGKPLNFERTEAKQEPVKRQSDDWEDGLPF